MCSEQTVEQSNHQVTLSQVNEIVDTDAKLKSYVILIQRM
jgi:hypothetical protein